MAYCDRCQRWFPHDRAYEQHTEDSDSHWICEDCNIDFASEESLVKHYANSPNHHYCRECDRHFPDEGARMQHMRAKHWYCEIHNRVRDRQSNDMAQAHGDLNRWGDRCFDRRRALFRTTGKAMIIRITMAKGRKGPSLQRPRMSKSGSSRDQHQHQSITLRDSLSTIM